MASPENIPKETKTKNNCSKTLLQIVKTGNEQRNNYDNVEMKNLQTEELQSLTRNEKPVSLYLRWRRMALFLGTLTFSIILLVFIRRIAIKLTPQSDFIITKNTNKQTTNNHHDEVNFCYIAGQLPGYRATNIMDLRQQFHDYSSNNNDTFQQTITSLHQTASAFTQHSIKIHLPKDNLSANEPSHGGFFGVTFEFQAVDDAGNYVTIGGDEFVITVQGWSSGWSYKTSIYATDLGNGFYRATLLLPWQRVEHVNATLMHYYTAFEGFDYYGIQGHNYHGISGNLDHGPVLFEIPQNLLDFLSSITDAKVTPHVMLDNRPLCPPTQEGVDQLMSGIWLEDNVPLYSELTLHAKWEPFCCRLSSSVHRKPEHVKLFRIGSSTMPRPSVHVGDVYDLTRPFHERWVDALVNILPNSTIHDTLLFSAGLHQLLYGYNRETVVQLIRRMICQIAAVFPGRIIFLGPCPIQQQLYPKIDMTDQHVLLVNAILRKQILEESDGQLDALCLDIDVAQLVSYPNSTTGSLLDWEKTVNQLSKQRQVIHETQAEVNLTKYLRSVTNYGNRSIYFADIDDFLRPRPETYRDGDKVHDLREINNEMLFYGAHSDIIEQLLILRALGNP